MELVYRWARERLGPDLAARIAPYRAGYLPRSGAAWNSALFSGELLGVTATNALELGIDVGGLDAAVLATFPGTVASFRQQTGRAGRSTGRVAGGAGRRAGRPRPVVHASPRRSVRAGPPRPAVVNPANPNVLAAHMGCAAYEMPMEPTEAIGQFRGRRSRNWPPTWWRAANLRVRDGRLLWAGREAPAPGIDIRTAGRAAVHHRRRAPAR